MSDPLSSARGLHKSYRMGGETLEVLCGVDIDLHRGELVAIVGASGSGKSTLLNVLGLLDPPDQGTLTFQGRDILARGDRGHAIFRRRHVGFVFQFYHLIPELTAQENIGLPGAMRVERGPASRRERRLRTAELVERVGLTGRERHRPSQLSGGERQRVAIARALYHKPSILLCDEPTGNLDRETGNLVWDLLYSLPRESGAALLLVTHDERFAASCDRILRLEDGSLTPLDSSSREDPS